MSKKFIVHQKNQELKEDKSVTMTIRIDKILQERYDELSNMSNRSRNELIATALQYSLDNLELISNDENQYKY